jgi:histidinol-phosphate aminotransferase
VANPNNPTGAAVAGDVLIRIAQAAPQAAVLVDEAYYEFHGETLIGRMLIDRTPIGRNQQLENLFVARTFSKAYGLAGLRIGVLAGEARQMAMVRRVASPYNVNAAALAVLPDALQDREYVGRYVAQVQSNRERLQRELAALGLHYWPSHANFVLVRIGHAQADFVRALRDRGILVRDRHSDRRSDPRCEGCVRLTVGSDEHTETLIAALRVVVEQLGLRPALQNALRADLPTGVRA